MMLMLSEIERFRIVDEQNQTARLLDLSINLLADDYPPITKIFFRNARKNLVFFAWNAVRQIDVSRREIRVADLKRAETISNADFAREVALRRDVMDALILDLQHRRATRANDLWLEYRNNNLTLTHADFSLAAIWRRLSLNLIRWIDRRNLSDWRYVEFLRGDAGAVKNGAGYHLRINRLAPGEIAGFVDVIPYLHAAELLVLLPDELAADVFELCSPEKQMQIFEELDNAQRIELLTRLAPETATNVFKQLKFSEARYFLEVLPKLEGGKIIELLKFPEGTVGSLMTNDITFIALDLSVGEARDLLSEKLKKPNFVYFIYVVDSEKNKLLRGVVSLRRIFVAAADEKISDIMDEFVSTLSPFDDARTTSFRLIDTHLAALPVIGKNGELLGVLTIDAAVSAVAPRSWRDQAPRIFS